MVDAGGRNADASEVPTIATLLNAYKDRTGAPYEEMSRRSGYVLSVARLQQLATAPPKGFPKTAATVEALAVLLEVSESTIVLAFAQSLGISVRPETSTLAISLPPGTDTLEPADVDAIRAVIRQLVAARNSTPPTPPEPDFSKPVPGVRLAETEPLRVVSDRDQHR